MTTVRDPGRATLVGIVFMSVLLSRPTCAHISRGRLVYGAGPGLRIQGRSFSRDSPRYPHGSEFQRAVPRAVSTEGNAPHESGAAPPDFVALSAAGV